MANQFGSNDTGENVSGNGDTYGESVVGVQLDAPMKSGFEDGFNATGEDMSSLNQRGTDPTGVQLPFGGSAAEGGWRDGSDMSGLAPIDGFVDFAHMGAESDHNMGQANNGTGSETSAGAGFHLITSFNEMWSRDAAPDLHSGGASGVGPAMAGLPEGSISNQGYPDAGAGQGGIDSMQGLIFGFAGDPQGEQGTDSSNGGYR